MQTSPSINRSPRIIRKAERTAGILAKTLVLARMLETSNPQAITPDVRDSLAELQAFTGKAEEEAAFLVAAILDPTSGMDQAAMAAPQRAAVAELRDALNRAGLMAPCTLSGGRVGIWGDL